jgi:hypothetical protein
LYITLCTSACAHTQGPDGRVGDPAVPAARHAGGATAGSAPHPHPEVPGQPGHRRLVPNLHVGRHLYTVTPIFPNLNF